ncbi:SDR family NAD(P)-dependent oxidoreductase [Pseudonocardiaceae bacterium YIM PH 21723]|nr:SDR family NAD(P)-dependent oxidoreductase [Pseudonocardiaceae bacterium YIM PH 21723]
MRLDGKNVWITGGSSGIGAGLARELRARGAQVAISARRADALDLVSDGQMFVRPADVTSREDMHDAAEDVIERLGGIDIAIFNAGAAPGIPAHKWNSAKIGALFDLNVMGLVHGVEAVLPGMRERRSGVIVGVASMAGYRALPGATVYSATKAAMITMLEGLRGELARDGIRVQTVCPGYVATPLTEGNTGPMPGLVSAEKAARRIAAGIEAGRAEIVFPWHIGAALKLARNIPTGLWSRFVG